MALIGLADGDATITPGRWLRKEITVVASVAYTRADFAEAQDLIADGRIDLAGMHTSTIGLDELSSSLDALAAGRTDDIKVLVDPTV